MAAKSQKNSNTQMAEHLIDVLSGTYVLMVKTHGYHWNVTGQDFPQLHTFFETQYTQLFAATDEIAERIRALDLPAPGSMAAFLDNTELKEEAGRTLTPQAMLKDLLKSHEQMRECIIKAADFADEVDDLGSEDLLIQRLKEHEKTIWMIRTQLA